ncbi:LuxR C-terminal-related transcriptional regulator, partial [Amycolatopsis sp. NPDC006125]|uniref:LuxR C-terminal-related transcriptional regulator n=1 Tax=Amycolatopsis sp. NPDC006125 TaxID=3156730 RepID=UPI0033B614CB
MNDATATLDKPTLLLFTAWAKANHINLTPRPATATRPSQITAEQIYTDERQVPEGQLLTLREYQVLAGMALGMTNEEIGADLYIS